MSKRKREGYLTDAEIEEMLNETLSDGEDSFSSECDSSDNYIPSEADESSDEEIGNCSGQCSDSADEDDPAAVMPSTSSKTASNPNNSLTNGVSSSSNTSPANNIPAPPTPPAVIWDANDANFVPRFDIFPKRSGTVMCSKLNKDSTEMEIFLQMFPRSLLNYLTELY